jgi:hypothetical protein
LFARPSGFASVLRDYGLPRDALVPALAAFNVGVELGQIAVVLAVMFAFAALRSGRSGTRARSALHTGYQRDHR